MKNLLLTLLFFPIFLSAQVISTQATTLNFGNVMVGSKDSLTLSLKNTGDKTLNITNLKFYTTYNNFPFSASQATFQLNSGASITILVYFEPIQNILHNSELVVAHNGNSGYTAVDLHEQSVFPFY